MAIQQFDLKSIRTKEDRRPENYVLENEGLVTAIQMALWLGKPLLLTGAPGTGKTQLAFKIANMLSKSSLTGKQTCAPFLDKPFVFNTKTTSTATDLFYRYDAVRHFQQKYADQFNSDRNVSTTAHPYIRLNALGNAILQSYGSESIRQTPNLADLEMLNDFNALIQPHPRSSVVLIDEIDKAPRDFPNDLLNEIENMEFYLQELMNRHVKKPEDNHTQVLVIMTSNFEKVLPDAFLRRCLFYHIPFPEPAELVRIVTARISPYLEAMYKDDPAHLQQVSANLVPNTLAVVAEFNKIKSAIKEKTPTTSELLEWIKTLEIQGFFKNKVDFSNLDAANKKILYYSFPALTKSESDQQKLKQLYPVQ